MKPVMVIIPLIAALMFCVTACADTDAFLTGAEANQDIQAVTAGSGPESETAGDELESGTSGAALEGETEEASPETTDDSKTEQTEYIPAVPEAYFAEAERQGQVIRVSYESRDYTADEGEAIIKTAYVYLPYGYEENDLDTRYDILYLMHGWTMTAGDFFEDSESNIVNMLDNMIEAGNIPPLIVVCATFDAENQSQGFSRSVEELSVFHRDLRENLIPFIESRFHTYAEETTEEGLKASRDHRAFGGFSLGAVTTWYQFVYNLDYIKYFLPMSGDCWVMGTYGGLYYPEETVDYLEQMLDSGGWQDNDFRIYQGIGTADPIWDQTDSQIQEMLGRERFTPENLHYAIIEGGRHDLNACERYLYYGLQDFFGQEDGA